ncbi:Exportin-1 [Fragariocoptes setiger]|uniref:Exportin-1 n=1 Tax=Fragariocoptes setiger TaxID=1670756 RepID=A0ABQ7S9U2_9ACAR|nr:Exportin-1 [Fragariocoptes setiger]
MYTGDTTDRKVAENLLTQFKEDPNAWTRVDAILQYSRNQETKYFALQILENLIKTRWNALPTNQTSGIKSFIVDLIIKTSSDSQTMERERVYLTKLNMVLVQILKREWPKRWPTFISDIVGASRTNESLCQNNMTILKLLTEEVFDFSSGQLTQAKAKFLKDTMCSEFSQIFQLCLFVMESSTSSSLILCTLETLLPFLNWIPVGYIFETKLINELITKFLVQPAFRNVTLQCLTEIAAIKETRHDQVFVEMFSKTMEALESMLPSTTYIREAYANGKDDEQKFIQNLSLFLCTFLREHGKLIEQNPAHHGILNAAFHYLLLISDVEEVEIFKICLEYWNTLTKTLYEGRHNGAARTMGTNPESNLYTAVLSRLRYIIIGRMAKPEEVLVVENEQGEVVREFLKDTDSIQLYRNMRETLVYLTHLDYNDTERIMTAKLQNQVNGREWSWRNLNTLCWAIGSISGAMFEEDERRFLVTVIKDLLGLCEQKRGKDNKAIIAANIMYVVGQYPRFLRAHWKFLKTVVNKLFEFMHETHDGVQDMACDTFIKIAQKCRRFFVMQQMGETSPFIDEILSSMTSIICDLQPQQVHTFYEAVGCMIAAQTYPAIQEALIKKYMSLPNYAWEEIMQQAQKNVDVLKDIEACKQLGNILKTNTRACKALGHPYVIQLRGIYLDMLNVYKVMSCNITTAISTNGEAVTKQPLIRAMRTVKKETLKLISGWISQSHDNQMVVMSFIPPLLDAILIDYKQCPVPSAREPEVLSTMSIIVEKLNTHISPQIPGIFDAVFAVTLEMISENFEDYPEHRLNFYTLLLQIIRHCFDAVVVLPQPQFKLILDSIIWAIKHTMRNVADIGHQALMALLENLSTREEPMQEFYRLYCLDLLQHLFCVITDPSLTSGLVQQTTVLAYIFYMIESEKVKVPLNPTEQAAENLSNRQYVHKYVKELLKSVYPHLTDAQVEITVKGFFDLDQDIPAFKDHLRDFLVQIREYSGADDSDLFLAEREQALQKHEEEKRRRQMQVPGIINPHDIPEEMQD